MTPLFFVGACLCLLAFEMTDSWSNMTYIVYITVYFFFHMRDALLLKIHGFVKAELRSREGTPLLVVQGFESFNDTLNSMFIAGVPR